MRLALLSAVVAAAGVSLRPQADPIPGYLAQISQSNLTAVATDLVNLYGPRREDVFSPYNGATCTPSGTVYGQPTIDMAADHIRDLFLAMGYPSSAITFEALPAGGGRNVYVTKVGSVYPNVFIEFGGHYDTVQGSPGGNDNASGSSAVIELARVLRTYPNRYSMRFVLFAAEEFSVPRGVAYYGSNVHVQQALARGEQIKAGLVMDHIGWPYPGDPTGYMNQVSYNGTESNRIANMFDTVRSQYGIVIGFGSDGGVQNSDEHSYWAYGQVAVSSGGGWLYYRPNYHDCGDTVANISFTNVLRTAQQNLAVGLKLDAEPFGATGTSTSLTSGPNPSLVGQAVTLTATVTATVGTPTGTVTFRDGAAVLGSSSLNASGVATFVTSTLAEGLHPLTASYGGDATHSASGSPVVNQQVNASGNPAPSLTTVSPSSVAAGSGAFTLTVTGSGFGSGSVVRWNGADRATTFVSATQVTAAIGAADVATAGSASVTVFNPPPGGGTSNALTVTITGGGGGPAGLRAAYSMDEGSGTVLTDTSGQGNHGTLVNGPSWVAGQHGTALGFDGVDAYVTVPNSAALDVAGLAVTVEFWANVPASGTSTVLLAKPWVAGQHVFPFYQYAVEHVGASGELVFHFGTSTVGLRSFPMAAGPAGWRHVAFTYDGSHLRGYLGGVQQVDYQVPFALEARGTPLLLGVQGALGQAYGGLLDDVRLYGRALTAAEVQADMTTPVPPPTVTPPAFSLAAAPSSLAFLQTGTGTFDAAVTPEAGFAGTVTLTHAASAGLTVTPSSATSASPAYPASAFTVTAAAPGSYQVTVTGTSGALVRQAVVDVTVNSAATTTAITSHTPDPSQAGQAVSVGYSVTASGPGTPTGNVTVSDGTDSCTGTVAAGSCSVTFSSAGARNLTATYAGDANFFGSVSSPVPHTVTAGGGGAPIIYVSSTSNGTVGGIAFADEDILAYDTGTGTWSMYMDGSDVGLGSSSAQDVRAFSFLPDGSLLLVFTGATTIPNVGDVTASDIVRFVPTSLGTTTAGTFEWYFDGSDVGLTTSGEFIDALHRMANGDLVMSTVGGFGVPGASGADEDLIRFTPSSLGSDTSGSWSLYFDGSDVGLTDSSEDVWGAWINELTGDIYLSTQGVFSVPGVTGDGADIFVCTPGTLGSNTTCTFSPYWDGSSHGYGGEVLDGFAIKLP